MPQYLVHKQASLHFYPGLLFHKIQLQAQACGSALVVPNDAVATRTADQLYDGGAVEGALEWPALLRKLDRLDRTYRD